MKVPRVYRLLVPVTVGLLAGCEKEKVEDAAAEVVETVDEAIDEVVDGGAALSAGERSAMLGFVGHLSADTESVMALYDGRGMVRNLRSLDVWSFIRETATEEAGGDPEEAIAAQAESAGAFFGDEMFLAFGKETAPQVEGLVELQARMNYHQFRVLSRGFAQGLVEGDPDQAVEALSDNRWMLEILRDSGELMGRIESAKMPPMLAGLLVRDADSMAMAQEQIRSMLVFVADIGEPVAFEKGAASFEGYVIKGEFFAEQMEAGREGMDEEIGRENAGRLIEAMKTKELVIAMGKLDDYLLLYLGSDTDSCPIAADLDDSLAANDSIDFIDGFAESPVHGFIYGSEGLMKASTRGGMKDVAEGVRDGLQDVPQFGLTREMIALLDMIGEREDALLDLYDTGLLGGVITVDGGARFELFGGRNGNAFDYTASHQLASLGEGENVLLFGNWVNGEEHTKRFSELGETIVEAAYALTGKAASFPIDNPDFAEFSGYFQMFDGSFRNDLVALWDGLMLADEGLGNERALVVDLSASVPPIPGVPQELVEGGRFIRASYAAPVVDRAKLSESWTKVDATVRSMLRTVKEMGMGELNMLTPTSSEKDEQVTWFFDALAFSDDVKPSVTINDDWFVASTSRTHALDLVAEAGSETEISRSGAWLEFDVDSLREYLGETVTLVDDNGEVVFPDEAQLTEFRAELPRIREGLKSLEQFDAITLHDRTESGTRRITLHFKTR